MLTPSCPYTESVLHTIETTCAVLSLRHTTTPVPTSRNQTTSVSLRIAVPLPGSMLEHLRQMHRASITPPRRLSPHLTLCRRHLRCRTRAHAGLVTKHFIRLCEQKRSRSLTRRFYARESPFQKRPYSMPNRVESVFPVVLIQPAASSQFVPDAGFLVERYTGICSSGEDRTRTAID
jgi:hypothetical protein